MPDALITAESHKAALERVVDGELDPGNEFPDQLARGMLASVMDPLALQPIRMIDARGDPLAVADPTAVRALRDTVFGKFTPVLRAVLPIADGVARSWLRRSASPYLAELDLMAARTRVAGIYAINISYEYGCTTLAGADGAERAPTLRRTLDWPFLGLGRAAVVAWRAGPAGEFFDITWPGAVGTLTAIAPGRFAAALNQAPLLRSTHSEGMRVVDYARNLTRTLMRERGMPPLHLLRYVFETAPSFAQALENLTKVELARPALFTLIGCNPDEMAVVERRERDATIYLGAGSVANDWRQPRTGWEPRPCALADRRLDNETRCATIAESAMRLPEPFGWVVPPVRNWNTRLAVEMNAGEGWMRVLGFEPCNSLDAAPVTLPFQLTQAELENAAA